MINLNPISEAEFQIYLKATIKSYADHNVESGRWPKEESLRLAKDELDSLLPDGLDTPNNDIYVIESRDQNTSVGYLWVNISKELDEKSMFICDIEVHEKFRRKGYAEAAIHSIEKNAKALGVTRIQANIFGHNTKAQTLSEKLGYRATNVFISKNLR